MTPKEKADELFVLYEGCYPENYDKTGKNFFTDNIKKSALITVNEIMKAGSDVDEYAEYYWQEVKQEIEKL